MNVCSILFHHIHSLLLGGRSSLSELHSCTFLDSFLAPTLALRPRQPPSLPKSSTGVRHWSGDVILSNSGRYCSVYKLQDRKGYGLTKPSLISNVSYLNLGGWNFVWGIRLWILCPLWQRGPQFRAWREADKVLVPDIEGIQNKALCLWIATTC